VEPAHGVHHRTVVIDLYFWPTPNGKKISIFLEETGLPYKLIPVNIGAGDQFKPEFLQISPNNRMPAIVDHDVDPPISIFESGAILQYLGDKTGQFYPRELRARVAVNEWLMWQVAGLGPMMGQANHFRHYMAGKAPYAEERYTREVGRLFRVLDERLAEREYIAGDYSIADIASYPWVAAYKPTGVQLDAYANLARWAKRVGDRPAVRRGMAVGRDLSKKPIDEAAKKILFGQR
jgi:GST-like protein